MKYVDGFVLPIARDSIDQYRELAEKAAVIWKEHGALEYIECIGDDLQQTEVLSFPKLAGCRSGETVVFAWIVYESKAHRDAVNRKVMEDARMRDLGPQDLPFDCGRMAWGGFSVLVGQ